MEAYVYYYLHKGAGGSEEFGGIMRQYALMKAKQS